MTAVAQSASVARPTSVPSRMVVALVWRARREGLKSLFLVPAAISLFPLLMVILVLVDPSGLHGVLSSPAITGGGVMGYLVAFTAMMAALIAVGLGASLCVQSAVGSEAVNGSFELMLGTGFTPRQIWNGFVRVLLVAVTATWAVVGVVLAIVTTALVLLDHIGLRATALFWVLLVFSPLALSLAGAILALGVGLAHPALFEPNRNGLVHTGGGGIAAALALAPAFICMIVFATAFSSLGATGVAVICVATVLISAGIGCWFGLTQFSREQVISSL